MGELALEDIFKLHKKLRSVPFSSIVSASSKFKIIPIDANSQEDKELLKYLSFALNNFIRLTNRSGTRFMGQRINDVGKKIENLIVEEFKKTPLEITQLGASGYPDFQIRYKDRVTHLELKITGNIKKEKTHHRMFYYSSGKKITSDGRHLLLQIQMEEESNKYWKVVSWQLRDLEKLNVSLKTEFNANFSDFAETTLLNSG